MGETTLMHIERLLDQLTFEEQIAVVEHLARRLRQAVQKQKQPQDLYGIWRDLFPADFDPEAALSDIRRKWEREWPQETGE
jgi:hypothetical protein